jgi:ankyrin repeat protein
MRLPTGSNKFANAGGAPLSNPVHSGTYIMMGVGLMLFMFLIMVNSSSSQKKADANEKKAAKRNKDAGAAQGALAANVKTAIESGNINQVRRWLKSPDVDPDSADTDGRTPMHFAGAGGYGDIMRLLLDEGADPVAEDSNRNTPLHAAAAAGHGLCVKLLLDGGASASAINAEGKTSLDCAKASNKVGCVLLLQRRINAEAAGSAGAGGGANPVRLRGKGAEDMAV